MKKMIPVLVVAMLAVGGGAFYGGTVYAKSKNMRGNFAARTANGMPTQGGAAGQARGGFAGGAARGGMGGFTSGEILSKDASSITVKLAGGGSKIVFLSDATTVKKTTDATKDDLTVGAQVIVTGKAGTDGSVTADTVSLGTLAGLRPNSAPTQDAKP